MSRRPWFPFYAGDYVADTKHLTLEQHGAYLLLMCHYYRTTHLPAESVYRICSCATDADRKTCDSVLREFFVRDGEVYRHKRIEEEIVKLDRKSESCAARAKVAANARWKRNSALAASVPAPQQAAEPPAVKTPKPKFNPLAVTLPKGLSEETWKEWATHRAERKPRLTEQSVKRQLRDLAEWINRGMDAEEIIHNSIRNSWAGLFPLNGKRNGSRAQEKQDGTIAAAQRAIARVQ